MSGVGTSFALPVSVDLSHEFWLVDMRASTSLIEEKRKEESGREREGWKREGEGVRERVDWGMNYG